MTTARLSFRFDVSAPLAFLRDRRDEIDQAIASLEALATERAVEAVLVDAPTPPTRKPARAAKPKAAPATTGKRKAPAIADDEPVARKGKAPTVGVQSEYCATDAERRDKVAELKAAGFTRAGTGVRLGPGMFDVRPSGDEDGTSVVLWRDQEATGE